MRCARVMAAVAAALVAGVVPAAEALLLPAPVDVESTRIHVFRPNLDGDRGPEQVHVANFDAAETPVTTLSVWDRVRGGWRRAQSAVLLTSPGNRQSGLVRAWGGDLNRDGRYEVAARNTISASAGENLVVMRQVRARSLRFARLQTILGDRVVMDAGPRPAVVRVLVRADHAADGRQHDEVWRWSADRDRWTCRTDCDATAGSRGDPAGGADAGGTIVDPDPEMAAMRSMVALSTDARPVFSEFRALPAGDTHDPARTRLYRIGIEVFDANAQVHGGINVFDVHVTSVSGGWRMLSYTRVS